MITSSATIFIYIAEETNPAPKKSARWELGLHLQTDPKVPAIDRDSAGLPGFVYIKTCNPPQNSCLFSGGITVTPEDCDLLLFLLVEKEQWKIKPTRATKLFLQRLRNQEETFAFSIFLFSGRSQ